MAGWPGTGAERMPRRGVVDRIWLAWRDPRRAMADERAQGLSEPRALLHLLVAMFLLFLSLIHI